MARISVDFSKVEDIEPIPAGVYPAVLTEVSIEEGNEYPYIQWVFTVEEPQEYRNRKLYERNSLSPKALFRLRRTLEAFGKDVPKGEIDVDPEEHIGVKVKLAVVLEPYEDRQVNRVEFISKLADAERKKLALS